MSNIPYVLVNRLLAEARSGLALSLVFPAVGDSGVFERSHAIFHERGLRARLPAAGAIRHQYHRSEFIGGDVVVTLHPSGRGGSTHPSWGWCEPHWTTKSTRRSSPILPAPIPTSCVRYEPDGLGLDVNAFLPTARTLRQFINSYPELLDAVTDAIRPISDAKG